MTRLHEQQAHGRSDTRRPPPCWQCGEAVGPTWLCARCGTIQPLPDDLDDFACLGLPRHLQLDAQDLAARFHERSRWVHPDFYQTKSSREQAISLEVSARLNRAYRTLRDPIERLACLIRLETGQREIAAKAPNDLLEEIFALQELVESYRAESPAGGAREKLKGLLAEEQARLQARLARLDDELAQLAAEWDRAMELADGTAVPVKQNLVARLKDRLAGRQYLVNTIEDITLTLEGRTDVKDRRH